MMRPRSLDEIPADRRLVSTTIAARRLGRDRRTIARWVSEDKLQPAACTLVWPVHGAPKFGGHLFWQEDVWAAARATRDASERTRHRGRLRATA